MPDLQLSNGTIIRTEHVKRAEFYPANSAPATSPELQDRPSLFLQMQHGAERISGTQSERDAQQLEAHGVAVIRHPATHPTPPL